jgi:hypothetical protein
MKNSSRINVLPNPAVKPPPECSSIVIGVFAVQYVVRRLFERIYEAEIKAVLPVYSTRILTAVAINSIEMAPKLKAKVETATELGWEAQTFNLLQLKLSKDIFRARN